MGANKTNIKISFILAISLMCFSCDKKTTNGYAFDADGSIINYDEFNTIVGEVDIQKETDETSGKKHIVFSYKGKGVYAPRISLAKNNAEIIIEDYNLLQLKFKVEKDTPRNWHLRFEQEGSPLVSESIKLFNYVSEDVDENGCYNCYIPLQYFLCPTKTITHAQLFANNYGSRNDTLGVDFSLYYLALKKVDDIVDYYPDFGIPKIDEDISARIEKVRKAQFISDETSKNGNNTHAGNGFSGEELFAMQKELRLLVHRNTDKAPTKRELEIVKLLRFGNPEREISYNDVQKKCFEKIRNNEKVELFYAGYDVYYDVLNYRATQDICYFERALVKADYVMSDPKTGVVENKRITNYINQNGTLGIGRGFSGISEVIIEINQTPKLQKKIAPSLYGTGLTYKQVVELWMPHLIRIVDEFMANSKYENGKWLEGDGTSVNRFLYFTHFLAAASKAAGSFENQEYQKWAVQTWQTVGEILSFFQGDCLLTHDRLLPSKKVIMKWDEEEKVFISDYGPYVIWAYAWPRNNTEDFVHIQMDIEAIDNFLEIDNTLLSEDFKKKMSTMLNISTFNTQTGGVPRDICPGLPGEPPGVFPPWHTHYVHEYGRYIGKYCNDEAYDEFLRYQLLVWDNQLINGKLGRFSQYPMPREVVEARLFRYNKQAPFPRGI